MGSIAVSGQGKSELPKGYTLYFIHTSSYARVTLPEGMTCDDINIATIVQVSGYPVNFGFIERLNNALRFKWYYAAANSFNAGETLKASAAMSDNWFQLAGQHYAQWANMDVVLMIQTRES